MKALPTKLILLILRLINLLPIDLQIRIGKLLGLLLFRLAHRRRKIAEVNINFCFRDLSVHQRQKLVKESFIQNGIGIIETGMAWWSRKELFQNRTQFEGLEHLQSALKGGKGAIILGAHYTTLDLGGLLFSLYHPLNTVYRPHNNPTIENVMRKGRLRSIDKLIDRSDFRAIIRLLRDNKVVWFAPDQDLGLKNSVFAPFFGIEAATVTATSRLAKISTAPVLMLAHHRTKDNQYILRLHPPIDQFPRSTDEESAAVINAELEKGISYDPSQYMWVHRRFKSTPGVREFY